MTVFDVNLVDRVRIDDKNIVKYLKDKAGVVKGDDDFDDLYEELLEEEVRREFGFLTTGAGVTFALRPRGRLAASARAIHVTTEFN